MLKKSSLPEKKVYSLSRLMDTHSKKYGLPRFYGYTLCEVCPSRFTIHTLRSTVHLNFADQHLEIFGSSRFY